MHTVHNATFLEKLIKRAPKTPAHRPDDSTTVRTYSTQAQIQGYADAYFDRLRFSNGDVDDLHITEPGLKVRELGFLDLTSEPLVTKLKSDPNAPWLTFSLAPTPVDRRVRRIREGE
jgi:hypothetical protein